MMLQHFHFNFSQNCLYIYMNNRNEALVDDEFFVVIGNVPPQPKRAYHKLQQSDVNAIVYSYKTNGDYLKLGAELGMSRRAIFNVIHKCIHKCRTDC